MRSDSRSFLDLPLEKRLANLSSTVAVDQHYEWRCAGERLVDTGELAVTAVWVEAANLVTAVGTAFEDQFAAMPNLRCR